MQEENFTHEDTYNFSITGLLKEGFNRTNGVKLHFVGAIIIYVIIALIVGAVLEVIFPQDASPVNSYISSILSAPVTVPIMVGITLLGIKQARDEELNIPSIFNYFNMVIPITLAYIAMLILLTIGFMLLIIPGLYLAVSYSFAYPLIVDKKLGIWEAMELSRKTITKQWFKFFGLGLVSTIALLISAIPLGVGLIWTIPMVYISYGLLYHHLFDDEED